MPYSADVPRIRKGMVTIIETLNEKVKKSLDAVPCAVEKEKNILINDEAEK